MTYTREAPIHSTRLDKWTNSDNTFLCTRAPVYRTVVRDYGDGIAEATVTICSQLGKKKGSHKTSGQILSKIDRDQHNRARAIARAKTNIRRSIMAAKLDHMLTLTYRDNMCSCQLAWKHFEKFARAMRIYHSPNRWPYVAVLEYQRRGAVHFHVALSGYQDIRLIRARWQSIIGGPRAGNVDIQRFQGSLPRLANYLSKYLTKDIGKREAGEHRYRKSRGIRIPQYVQFSAHDHAIDCDLIGVFESHGAEIKSVVDCLNANGAKWLWASSW